MNPMLKDLAGVLRGLQLVGTQAVNLSSQRPINLQRRLTQRQRDMFREIRESEESQREQELQEQERFEAQK